MPPLLPPPQAPERHKLRLSKRERKKLSRGDDGQDAWLITYADLITQLMCFFVILMMISKPEVGKMTDVAKAFASGFIPNMVETPYAGFYSATEQWIEGQGMQVDASVEYSNRGVALDFSGDALFGVNSATPTPDTVKRVKEFVAMLQAQKINMKRTKLIVEGYSDDAPTTGSSYASGWELSAARAASIVRLLAENQIPPDRMQIVAYGATHPKVANRDAANQPIPDNQKRNRRVVVRVERGE